MLLHANYTEYSQRRPRKFLLFIMVVFSIGIFIILLGSSNLINESFSHKNLVAFNKQCFTNRIPKNGSSFEHLHDIVDKEFGRPNYDKSIFFHEVFCPINDGSIQFNIRKACSIESAAKNNPNWQVYVLFPANVGFNKNLNSPILKSLAHYSNIQFRHIDLREHVKDTPIENLYNKEIIYHSRFMYNHITAFLPFLTLYKYGGITLDHNLIVQQSFDEIYPNYGFTLNNKLVQHEILNMRAGHPVSLMVLSNFASNYDSSARGRNASEILTQVLISFCDTQSAAELSASECRKIFKIIPEYNGQITKIGWTNYQNFFDTGLLEEGLRIVNNSIVLLIEKTVNTNNPIEVGDEVSFAKIAEANCPKVYGSGHKFF